MTTNGGAAAAGAVATEADGAEDDATELEAAAAPAQPQRERRPTRLSTPGHISRDYSYIRTELIRIAVVASFLVVALIITAIVRG